MSTATTPSQRFLDFIGFVKAAETVYAKGHYGDDKYVLVEKVKGDSGGTTKWGLDAATHGEGVANLTWPEAQQIYLDWYWNGQTAKTKWISVETLSPGLGEVVFDTRINSGMKPAKNLLMETQDPRRYLDLRDARNRNIAQAHPEDQKFLQGWLNRTRDLRSYLRL